MDLGCYNSYMEVNLKVLRDNCERMLKHIGNTGFIPVVKANGYGMGTAQVAKIVVDCGAKIIGMAQVYEGVQLREAGFKDVEVLVMGGLVAHTVPYAVKYDLQTAAFTVPGIELLSAEAKKQGKRAKVQIKVETGLHRIGVKPGEPMADVLNAVRKAGNIDVVGAFTHFATATIYDSDFTHQQYNEFVRGVDQIRAAGFELQYVSCCNSGGTVWFKDAYNTHVRNASLYMGYCTMEDGSNPLNVREPLSWRAFITNVHEIEAGESVGYGRYFMAKQKTKVATISIGYGDGLFRPLAMNGGPLLVNDSRAKYIGCCMDQCFADVTGVDCKIGDEVTIFGYSKGGALLSAFEIEKVTGQCYQNALCGANNRVKRVYIE